MNGFTITEYNEGVAVRSVFQYDDQDATFRSWQGKQYGGHTTPHFADTFEDEPFIETLGDDAIDSARMLLHRQRKVIGGLK